MTISTLQVPPATATTVEDSRLTELLRDRWSPRSFDPHHVIADDDLLALLQAAQWTPSAGNSQPWSFIVARRGDRTHEVIVDQLARGNASWAPQASAILLAIAQVSTGLEDDAPDFSDYAEYDLGQAAAHVTIQARALGLETRQFAGFDHEGIATAFKIPGNFKVMVGIAVGVHLPSLDADGEQQARDARPRVRKDVSDFAYSDTWGNAVGLGNQRACS